MAIADELDNPENPSTFAITGPPAATTINGVWGLVGNWSYNGGATSYKNKSTVGFCTFSPNPGPYWVHAGFQPTKYTRDKVLSPTNRGIPGAGSGIAFSSEASYYSFAFLMNVYSQNTSYSNDANAAIWKFTNKASNESLRYQYHKMPRNTAQSNKLADNAKNYRGPYKIVAETPKYYDSKTINSKTYKDVVTSKVSFKSGSNQHLINGIGASVKITLTNATFLTGSNTVTLNGKERSFDYKVTTPGKSVKIKYELVGLPSKYVSIYKPNGGLHQPLFIPDNRKDSISKEVSVNTPAIPAIKTTASLDKTKVGDKVEITGGKANGSATVTSTLYYGGTTPIKQSDAVPLGAKKLVTRTNEVTLDGSGAASFNVTAFDVMGQPSGYYTWVTKVSGSGMNTVTSPYGVPSETTLFESFFPGAVTGASISNQKPNGSYDTTDTIAINDGKPNGTATVTGQVYYHGTEKPTQSEAVPAGAVKVGSAVSKSVALDASGAGKATLPVVNIPASGGVGYYTWVTTVDKVGVTYTSPYGVESETFYFPGKTDVAVETTTSTPVLKSSKWVVNDTIKITGNPGLTGLSVKSELYYHGANKPSPVSDVPSGAKLISAATNTQTVNLDASGSATVKTPDFYLKGQETGYYTWVTTVSGDGVKTTKSKYGVPSETFHYTKVTPAVTTTAAKGTFDSTTATFKDTIVVSKGIPGANVTIKAQPYYSSTKPTQVNTVPSGAKAIGEPFSTTKTLSATGSVSVEATVNVNRNLVKDEGWVTWVVTVSGAGDIDPFVTPYGVPSETVEWGGAQAGVTTQTSDAQFLSGGVKATDTIYITGESSGAVGNVTFQLYYHGTTKPSKTATVPSGATKVGSQQSKPVTLDQNGNATITSDPVTIPIEKSGYYTWVTSYEVSIEVPVEEKIASAIGVRKTAGMGTGVITTDKEYYVTNNSLAKAKANLPSGTQVASAKGDWPYTSDGSSVITTSGDYYLVKLTGEVIKSKLPAGVAKSAIGVIPLNENGGSGVITTAGDYYIVKNTGAVTKSKLPAGVAKSAIGSYPAKTGTESNGSGVITTAGDYYIVKSTGDVVKAKLPSGTKASSAVGFYPASTGGSGVVTTGGAYYIVKSTGDVVKAKLPSGVEAKSATGTQPATTAGSGVITTTGDYYLVDSAGAVTKSKLPAGKAKTAVGIRPLKADMGSGVQTTDGNYYVVKNTGAVVLSKLPAGVVRSIIGDHPAASTGGATVITTAGDFYYVKSDGNIIKSKLPAGVTKSAVGAYPLTGGAGVVTTSGDYYLLDSTGAISSKLAFPPNKVTTSKVLEYGVPSETFQWQGYKKPNVETEANGPVVNATNSTVDFTDQVFLSGGTPGVKVKVDAKLYYSGTTKPTEVAAVPSGATLIKTLSKTVTLDGNGASSFTTDKATLDPYTAKDGYYTWVITTSSPDGQFASTTSKYGIDSETVYLEGISKPSISTTSSALTWTGSSAKLTDSVSLSGGTPGVEYSVTATLYRSKDKPVQSASIPSDATKIGTTPAKTMKIGADGTVTVDTSAITLPTGPLGGAQPGYYTWVVTAKGVKATSQTVTTDFGVPSETVYWEGWKTPDVVTSASLSGDKKSSTDTVLISGGTSGTKVTVKAQLYYYAGTTPPQQSNTIPSGATKVGASQNGSVTLDANGAGSFVTSGVALPQDPSIGQSKVGYYTWVVETSGDGIKTQVSDFGVPEETVTIGIPEEQDVVLSTSTSSNSTATPSYDDDEVLLINKGDRLKDTFWAVGDALTKYPTTVTATLYGPIKDTAIPTEVNTTKTPKFFETTINVNKPGEFQTGYSPAVSEPGLYVWTYSFPGKTLTSDSGDKYTIYKGRTDNAVYVEEAARLLFSPETDTTATPKGPSHSGVEVSDKVTISGYLPNTEVVVESYLWGPYVDKPALADNPLEIVIGQEHSDPEDPESPMVDVYGAPQVGSVATTIKTDANGEATFVVDKFPEVDMDCDVGEDGESDCPPIMEPIVLEEGGWYVWTDSIDGVPGVTKPWQSKFGVESEMQYVNNAFTVASEDYVQEGDKVSDTFTIYGPLYSPEADFQLYKKGNSGPVSDTLVYDDVEAEDTFVPCPAEENVPAPKGCKQVTSPEITVGDNTVLEQGQSWEPGTYYWRGKFFNDGKEVFRDQPRLPEETFQYFTAVSDATRVSPYGAPIKDIVTLEGGLPVNLQVTFELYKQGSGGVSTDTPIHNDLLGSWVKNEETGNDTWVPKEFPVWPEYYGSGNTDQDLPGSATKIIESPEINGLDQGQYYWISKVVVGGESGGAVVYSDTPRMENESSFVGPEVTTKTKGVASIGEEVFDTATLSGPTPEGSTLIFELWKHGSGNSSTDTKVYTSAPVPAKNQGDYNSPTVKINESGIYYWIEKLIAPDGTTELAVGSPRLDNETVYVPKIGTSLVDSNGNKEILASASTTLVDTVTYESLRPGIAYDITGQLYHPDGTAVKVNGQNVTSTKTFTPTQSSGTVTVSFTFSTADLSGTDLVAFEKLFVKGETTPVATHEDPEDPGQTVSIIGTGFQVEKLGMGVRVAGSEWELRGPTGTNNVQTGAVMPGQSPAGSVFKFDKVVPGEYDLVETKAPEGYELLAKPIKVTVSAGGEVTVSAPAAMGTPIDGNPTITVGDVPTKALPETGGFGWAWGIIAAVVIAGGLGGARLIIKRKKA